jgi:hypothetical protein
MDRTCSTYVNRRPEGRETTGRAWPTWECNIEIILKFIFTMWDGKCGGLL